MKKNLPSRHFFYVTKVHTKDKLGCSDHLRRDIHGRVSRHHCYLARLQTRPGNIVLSIFSIENFYQ